MNFKINEMIRLIKVCAQVGVSEFSFGEIKVSFAQHKNDAKMEDGIILPPVPDHIHDERERQDMEKIEIGLRESEIEELKIRDPFKYEELVALGEFLPESDQ